MIYCNYYRSIDELSVFSDQSILPIWQINDVSFWGTLDSRQTCVRVKHVISALCMHIYCSTDYTSLYQGPSSALCSIQEGRSTIRASSRLTEGGFFDAYNGLTQRGLSCTLPAIPMRRRMVNCWSHWRCRCRTALSLSFSLEILHADIVARETPSSPPLGELFFLACAGIRAKTSSTVTSDAISLLIEVVRGTRNF